MKNAISITEMMKAAEAVRARGEHFTYVGIGPMSRLLLKAVLSLAKDKDFPVMLIASRNQVDSDEFGGGYVNGYDQQRFVADTEAIAAEVGFDGLCYFCRDHGGPWQRDEERAARLPVEKAMDIAVRSYIADVKAGFHLLHIDPTKDPFITGTVPLDTVLSRTVALVEKIEAERKRLNLPEIGYEAGTEETNGGLTSVAAFENFIVQLVAALKRKNLPAPLFVVGQTGTLTRIDENVGHYDRATADKLNAAARAQGVNLKEHNGDYLSNAILLEHTALNLGSMNVAPEFGYYETVAYRELCETEDKFIPEGRRSGAYSVIGRYAVQSQRWRKWMVGADKTAADADVFKDAGKLALITRVCGHYTYNVPEVRAALAVLYENLRSVGIDCERYALKRVMDSIDRYVYCFNLYGKSRALIETAKKNK
jgi:tagatose-1,6-bisphosphate aldolase non-catalytic subunit AgaZ/GatZ